jgi:hypothetical protein
MIGFAQYPAQGHHGLTQIALALPHLGYFQLRAASGQLPSPK